MPLALVLSGAVLAASLFTFLARHYALRRNLLDHPDDRRSHVIATPRGGGVAIVLVLLMASAAAACIWPAQALYAGGFSVGLAMVAGIGWWDDHRPLPAMLRLAVHAAASALLALMLWRAGAGAFHAVLVAVFTASLINIWNFMDGINGLAVTQAILVATALALALPVGLAWIGWILAAACLGFLPFNFPKARIFLGDVGSGALGYALAALLALTTLTTELNWLVLMMPMTAFLVDASFTLMSRMLSGKRWMEAHREHLYQRLVQVGSSHAVITSAYAVFSVASVTIAGFLVAYRPPVAFATLAAAAWIAGATVLWWVMRRNLESKGSTP